MRSSSWGLRRAAPICPAELAPAASDPSSEDVVDDSGVVVRLLLEDIADGRDDNPNVMIGLVGGAWDPGVTGGDGVTAGSGGEPEDLEGRVPSRVCSVVRAGLTGIFGWRVLRASGVGTGGMMNAAQLSPAFVLRKLPS